MRFPRLRPRAMFEVVREAVYPRAAHPDPEFLIVRWREAMARERKLAWPAACELIPVRTMASRHRG